MSSADSLFIVLYSERLCVGCRCLSRFSGCSCVLLGVRGCQGWFVMKQINFVKCDAVDLTSSEGKTTAPADNAMWQTTEWQTDAAKSRRQTTRADNRRRQRLEANNKTRRWDNLWQRRRQKTRRRNCVSETTFTRATSAKIRSIPPNYIIPKTKKMTD